jgi:hypothetical protein
MYSLSKHGKNLINLIVASRLRASIPIAKILTVHTFVVRLSTLNPFMNMEDSIRPSIGADNV